MYHDFEYVRHGDLGIALIRRAASTTINRTIPNTRLTDLPDVPLIAFVRDPIDRLHSGFKALPGSIPDFPEYMTYTEHVDRVLAGSKERHWDPQAEVLSGIDNLTLYRFEDLEEVWVNLGLPELKPHNMSPNDSILDKDYRLDDLMEFYRCDYRLRYGHCR